MKLTTPKTFTSLWIAIVLVLFQQCSGQPTILYFLNRMFETIGVSSASTIWVSLLMFMTTLVTPLLIDRLGRKMLLGVGCLVMLLSLLIAATILSITTYAEHQSDIIIAVIALCCYIIGYEYSFGTVIWPLIAELSPIESKELILSISVLINLMSNFIISALFPWEVEDIGLANSLFLYAAVVFTCLLFISTNIIPETKGLTLEEIERLMVQRWSPSTYTYLDIDEA
jgi:SP family galactose:H+ symporter-like MFS transporter